MAAVNFINFTSIRDAGWRSDGNNDFRDLYPFAVAEPRPHISRPMRMREQLRALGQNPMVRQVLFLFGIVLVIVSPLVGAIPGPGGVIVFAAGLGLMLKYSEWAKRQYVRFKRAHPNKGRWADWGLRRRSHRRREARRQELEGVQPDAPGD
jgi:hypothetical protein